MTVDKCLRCERLYVHGSISCCTCEGIVFEEVEVLVGDKGRPVDRLLAPSALEEKIKDRIRSIDF